MQKALTLKAIIVSAVTIVGAFCLAGKLSPCPDGGAYFAGDGCLPSPLSLSIRAEINRRLSIEEQYCGKRNAEVYYAYWDDFSDFDDRFGQFCTDYSKVVIH